MQQGDSQNTERRVKMQCIEKSRTYTGKYSTKCQYNLYARFATQPDAICDPDNPGITGKIQKLSESSEINTANDVSFKVQKKM